MKAWKKWLIAVFSIVLVAGIAIGTVWLVNNWDALTSDTTLYTQEDIDDAYEQGLNDAGYEVILQYQEQIAIIQGQLEESQIKVGNLTDSLNQALAQHKIDQETIAGYLDDITELNNTITDLNNQIKLYQELLEAYENSGKYEVVFYLVQNGEQTPYDVQVVEPNGYLSDVVEPEGNFEGWSLTIGGDLIESLTSVQITEDTNIYGTFYSTVTFMVNDEEYSTQQVGYNKYATEPEEPEVQYYTFEGWTLNGEDIITVNSYPITEDTTFVAKLTKIELSTFIPKTWNGLTEFDGEYVWTDGEQYYYSNADAQYVLNKETSTWTEKTWNKITTQGSIYPYTPNGISIWTDSINVYDGNDYVLNVETGLWEEKTWYGLEDTIINARIWTDGENVYYDSTSSEQFVLNVETSTWEEIVINGMPRIFKPSRVWTDGVNTYYSDADDDQLVFDKETKTWEEKIWNNMPSCLDALSIWKDENNIYFSYDLKNEQYVLKKGTDTWEEKTWNGITAFNGNKVWTDGENFYYSFNAQQYVIV